MQQPHLARWNGPRANHVCFANIPSGVRITTSDVGGTGMTARQFVIRCAISNVWES